MLKTKKTQLQNGSFTTDYVARVKTYLPPQIMGKKTIDGVLHYNLSNGATQPAAVYDALWHPKYGSVNLKARDKNPDKSKEWMKD